MTARPAPLALLALAGLVAFAAFVALLPAAAAQAPEREILLEVSPPLAPLPPDGGDQPLPVTVTVGCTHLLASAAQAGDPTRAVEAVLEFNGQPAITVAGPATMLFEPQACSGVTAVSKQAEFRVSVSRTAPGLEPLPMQGAASMGGAKSEVDFSIVADYYEVSQVHVARKLLRCSPCDGVRVDLQVANLGNARTQYAFSVEGQPSSGWSIELPGTLVVPNGGNATATAVVRGGGGEGAFHLLLRPSAAIDPSKEGNPLQVHVLVRDTSLASKLTPGPGPLLAGLALLGLALSRRRA